MSELGRHAGIGWYAARNVARRWRRSLAVTLPLGLAIAVAMAATLIADGIRRDAALAASFAADLTFQRLTHGRIEPFEVAPVEAALRASEGVVAVRSRVFSLVPAPEQEEADGALATLVGIDGARAHDTPHEVVEGRLPQPGETGAVALGRGVSGALRVGAVWDVATEGGKRRLEIVGLLSDAVAIHGANLALASPEDVRAIAGIPPTHASELAVALALGADAAALAADMQERFGLRAIGRGALTRILDAVYGSRSGAFATIWLILLLVAPAVAWALGMDVAAAETHEMGVLKSLGWSTLELVEARMVEGALLGVSATVFGALAGVVYALLGAPGIAELFVGWAATYPSFHAPLALEPASALAILAVGVVPILAAMAVPAWRAGAQSPEAVMRE